MNHSTGGSAVVVVVVFVVVVVGSGSQPQESQLNVDPGAQSMAGAP